MKNYKTTELKITNRNLESRVGLYIYKHDIRAKEIYLLLSYALKNDTFKTIFTAEKYTTTNNISMKSTKSKYITYGVDMSDITGTKTGYIKAAGNCLASTATFNGADFMLITLNAHDQSNGNPSIND